VRGSPKPEEELAGELDDGGVGGSAHCLSDILA
jgi:hypothetical protein